MTLTEKKILNGIKYFTTHTKNVGRTKLFKLLYFWDFIHFKKYGASVTGYDYLAFPFGPVPKRLYDSIVSEQLPDFLKGNISIIEDDPESEDDTFKKFKILSTNRKIDYNCFSPNELNILKEVAFIFKDATARDMTEITHIRNTPWDITKEKGLFTEIDYFLAIDDDTPFDVEEIKERFFLQKELIADGRH